MPAALLLLFGLTPGFVFSDVAPWRWNEARGERIPALSGMLDNRSGEDWAEARFHVLVRCAQGGESAYDVLLHDVLLGPQKVNIVAFDAIGEVKACDGSAEISFTGGRRYDEAHRPSYAVLGFSYRQGDAPASLDLEGILDVRSSDSGSESHAVYWRDSGRRIDLPGMPDTAFYCFRVEPGTLGLAGFLLDRNPGSTGPLNRFLRFYEIPAGKAVFLGVFRIAAGPGRMLSMTLESGEEALRAMGEVKSRPLIRAPAFAPGPKGGHILGQ